ncbi:MAG: serine--tRNA ligase [Spirochaetia bacterium]|nr:serine--tRNA ligase [Spirochaetia bacterium]MCF7946471.1 serine--tRNA ligase [Spirochaetia bacterium]
MIDLHKLQENYQQIKENIKNRYMDIDLDSLIKLQNTRRDLIKNVENLRNQRNINAKKMKGKMSQEERSVLINEGKQLKQSISQTEELLKNAEQEFFSNSARIPNYAHPEAPVGKEDKDNLELKRWGTPKKFDFTPKDHIELGNLLDLIDFETASRVTGTKFYYLKNDAVLLELALERFALQKLQEHGFTPTITPDLAKQSIASGIGFNPRGEESNIYNVEDTDLCLVGTAEITLGGYYANQIIEADQLPVKLAGLSHCFRKEAGAAGQYSKGLYRVHQFSKVEMFVICSEEESDKLHEELLAIEEEIFQSLEIPYRVVDTCTGDLGAPAYRKFDLEAWMPGRGESGDWGEVTSTSNCTDYQSRSLSIRYKKSGEKHFVHMLNGTAIAVSRALVALLENNQREDGSIAIPKVLQPFIGKETIKKKYTIK